MNKYIWQIKKYNGEWSIYTGDDTRVSSYSFNDWADAQVLCDEHNSALVDVLTNKIHI